MLAKIIDITRIHPDDPAGLYGIEDEAGGRLFTGSRRDLIALIRNNVFNVGQRVELQPDGQHWKLIPPSVRHSSPTGGGNGAGTPYAVRVLKT